MQLYASMCCCTIVVEEMKIPVLIEIVNLNDHVGGLGMSK